MITPNVIEEWKAERRRLVAAERFEKTEAMNALMERTRATLRAEAQKQMDVVLNGIDDGYFDEQAKKAILIGLDKIPVLNFWLFFSTLSDAQKYPELRCQHWHDMPVHHFGASGCQECASVLRGEMRPILASITKRRGLKFSLPRRNDDDVILSF